MEATENLHDLLHGLKNCKLKMNDRKMVDSGKLTRKEVLKSKRMSRDGQVLWSKFTMLKGQIDFDGNTVMAIQFKLQCIPSMRSDVYPVKLVFTGSESEKKNFREANSLSYCFCKAGAITSKVCSHRLAVRDWLHKLCDEWTKKAPIRYRNFHDVARTLGLPRCTFHVSQLPIHVKPTFLDIQKKSAASNSQDDVWATGVETSLNQHNEQYLNDALESHVEARCKKVCRTVLRNFRADDTRYDDDHFRMGAWLIYLIHVKCREEKANQ